VRDRPFRQVEALHDAFPHDHSARFDGADLEAGFELLHAQRHDRLAFVDA
jgi:hypothetical protein